MDNEAEIKYAQVLAELTRRLGATVPDDLPENLVILPLLMAMIGRQNAINIHHGRMLEKLDSLVERIAALEAGHVR